MTVLQRLGLVIYLFALAVLVDLPFEPETAVMQIILSLIALFGIACLLWESDDD